MTEFLKEGLEIYFIENKAEADKIAEQILINKRSREQAEKARLNIKKKLSGNIDLANRVQKFVDCRTKDASRRELYIVEGDSALGSVKQGRDSEFQAIMPVRGKILNCLKADYDKIFKNDIITDLLKVLGCGVEVRGKAAKDLSAFDLESLRWHRIIICTDADVDGMHIRLLLITFFLQFFPDLIKKGHVYILQTPLFRVRNKKKTVYCYSEDERVNAINELSPNPEITRFKGLGEISPDEFKHFIGKDMRLEQVTLRKTDAVKELLEFYMGKNTMERQNFIIDNLVIEEDLAS